MGASGEASKQQLQRQRTFLLLQCFIQLRNSCPPGAADAGRFLGFKKEAILLKRKLLAGRSDMREIFFCHFLYKILRKCFAEKQKYLTLSYFSPIHNIIFSELEHAYFGVSSATVVPELRIKQS